MLFFKTLSTVLFLFIIVLFISSCAQPIHVMEADRTFVQIDVNLGFVPNSNARYNASLITPSPGLHGFRLNDTVSLESYSNDLFVFYKWEVKPKNKESYEIFEEDYSFIIQEDHVINVFFGCNKNEACGEGYVCVDKLCKVK